MSAARKGHIYLYERDIDSKILILAANTMPSKEYTSNLQETLKKEIYNTIRKDYRRRIN